MSSLKIENGYYIWKKGERFKFGKYFSTHEFDCQCSYSTCVNQKISVTLITNLNDVREKSGGPISVTSGFRCAQHQNDLRSQLNKDGKQGTVPAGSVSQHELGNAADIVPRIGTLAKLRKIVEQLFNSIGIARTFIHVDTRPKRPDGSKRIWNY